MKVNIGVIKGDGIGPEIVTEAKKVLDRMGTIYGHEFRYTELLMGGASIDVYGVPLTDATVEAARQCDAILMGSIGGNTETSPWYQLEPSKRPEAGLLKLRKELKLFANLRPATLYEELKDASDSDFEFAKLHFEDVKEINIKDIFAFTSHISLYNKCPRLYKLYKKYEFIPEKNKGMIFGTLVHETLEDINRKIFRKENISEDIIKEIFIENYKNIYKKYKINIDKDVLISGEKSIEEYVKNYPEITENIKDVEVKLSLIKEKYILEGIIDLVLEKDGGLEIVDFKTGKRGTDEEGYINQLEIYAYLLKKKYGKKVKSGKLYYLGENKENRITEVYFTKERLSQAVKNFDETAERIINKNFECSFDEKSRKCNSCYLKNYCIEEMSDV